MGLDPVLEFIFTVNQNPPAIHQGSARAAGLSGVYLKRTAISGNDLSSVAWDSTSSWPHLNPPLAGYSIVYN
jgi:hypothetical protein